jgi:quaternary ammonium compound-resistance protein SugE
MSPQAAWLALVTAGLLDVGWAISMKYAEGYTRLGWSLVSVVLLAAFVFLLGRALAVLEIGIAYTVWTGIGAVGTLTMGVLLFGEALSPMKIAGIVLVMSGIVALKLQCGHLPPVIGLHLARLALRGVGHRLRYLLAGEPTITIGRPHEQRIEHAPCGDEQPFPRPVLVALSHNHRRTEDVRVLEIQRENIALHFTLGADVEQA